MLDAALHLASLGFSVVPLKPRSKFPHGDLLPRACYWPRRNDEDVEAGHGTWLDAQYHRAEEATIRAWFATCPAINIGIATGAISGIVVLDADDIDTSETVVAEHGGCTTRIAYTASGCHRYLAHPGHRVKNRVKFLPGLDMRGDGGYVVAPPSIHPSGKQYTWHNEGAPISAVPVWLAPYLEDTQPAPLLPETRTVTASENQQLRDVADVWFEREVSRVKQAPDRQKHPILLSAAIALAGFVPLGALDENDIFNALHNAVLGRAKNMGLADRTIQDGIAYGKQRPWKETDVVPPLTEPIYNDEHRACCPYHGEPLVRSRNGNGWRCKEVACRPDGKRFWWAGNENYDEARVEQQKAQEAQRKRNERKAHAAEREAMLDRVLETAKRDDLTRCDRAVLAVMVKVSRGRGWHRLSIPRIAEMAEYSERAAWESVGTLLDRGYMQGESQPGHTTIYHIKLPEPFNADAAHECSEGPDAAHECGQRTHSKYIDSKILDTRVDPVCNKLPERNIAPPDNDDGWESLLTTAPTGGSDPAGWEWDDADTATDTGAEQGTPEQVVPVAPQDAPQQAPQAALTCRQAVLDAIQGIAPGKPRTLATVRQVLATMAPDTLEAFEQHWLEHKTEPSMATARAWLLEHDADAWDEIAESFAPRRTQQLIWRIVEQLWPGQYQYDEVDRWRRKLLETMAFEEERKRFRDEDDANELYALLRSAERQATRYAKAKDAQQAPAFADRAAWHRWRAQALRDELRRRKLPLEAPTAAQARKAKTAALEAQQAAERAKPLPTPAEQADAWERVQTRELFELWDELDAVLEREPLRPVARATVTTPAVSASATALITNVRRLAQPQQPSAA